MNNMPKDQKLMIGMTVAVKSREEAESILDKLAERLEENFTGKQVVDEALQFVSNGEIRYIAYGIVMGMRMITLPIETEPDEDDEEDEDEEFDMTSEYGVFSYVYNVDADWCSELGYTVFEEVLGELVRIA